ncbi:hypothetical protein J1605_018087 [Eschrichtius robustus]|uniref:Uncharacterized protein n=1 Tax=Eschrichtius robustus TaxID=9764 RepID=A0AB34HZ82_ESCRO|nr:hypothetical protein J1605_018087 [Eschrichtius robustus]
MTAGGPVGVAPELVKRPRNGAVTVRESLSRVPLEGSARKHRSDDVIPLLEIVRAPLACRTRPDLTEHCSLLDGITLGRRSSNIHFGSLRSETGLVS